MIQKTTDYSKFKTLKANRVLNQNHLAKLTVSISKRNMLENNPIIVNENMEVIDGQHRLEVAKANHWPIWFTVVTDAGIDEVLEMNTNLRVWKLQDFVDSLIVRGNKEMAYLKEFSQEWNLSLSSSIIAHMGGGLHPHGNPATYLARMTFSDEQKKIAERTADLYETVHGFTHQKGMLPRAVLLACRKLVGENKDKKIMDAIKARAKIVAVINDEKEMYRILNSYAPVF
jgi:hypothetical protein